MSHESYVRQHFLEVADAGGKGLHFSETLVYLFQPLTDLFERFAQPLLQRALKLLINGQPHLLKLGGVVSLHALELSLDCGTDGFELFSTGFGERFNLL